MKSSGTPVYARQHKCGLTLAQQNAIDLLAAGRTDTEAARMLNLHRTTVTKWRLYDPAFQAALNRLRAEVWGAAIDRLRGLVPKALDALADALETKDDPNRLKAACEILRMAQLPAPGEGIGLTDADAIIAALVEAKMKAQHAERLKYLSTTDRLLEDLGSPPSKEEADAQAEAARAEVLSEIAARLQPDEEDGDG